MSTYYFLVCEKCREVCDAASLTGGGRGCHLVDSALLLPKFICAHRKCEVLRIVSEHVELDESYSEWTADNWTALWDKERP